MSHMRKRKKLMLFFQDVEETEDEAVIAEMDRIITARWKKSRTTEISFQIYKPRGIWYNGYAGSIAALGRGLTPLSPSLPIDGYKVMTKNVIAFFCCPKGRKTIKTGGKDREKKLKVEGKKTHETRRRKGHFCRGDGGADRQDPRSQFVRHRKGKEGVRQKYPPHSCCTV